MNVVVVCTECRQLLAWECSIRECDILCLNVNVVEQLLVDAIVATLLLGRFDRVELVEAVNCNICKAYLACLVTLNELTI